MTGRWRPRLAGHPVHPPTVHFPVALWTTATVCDALALGLGGGIWWNFSFFCLGAGTVAVLPTLVTGLLESTAVEEGGRAERVLGRHVLTVLGASGAYLGCLLLRVGERAPEGWRLPASVGLSVVGMTLLAIGGWFGAELVYRHGIGLSSRGTKAPRNAPPSPKSEKA